jgi:hypothetical protein
VVVVDPQVDVAAAVIQVDHLENLFLLLWM